MRSIGRMATAASLGFFFSEAIINGNVIQAVMATVGIVGLMAYAFGVRQDQRAFYQRMLGEDKESQ